MSYETLKIPFRRSRVSFWPGRVDYCLVCAKLLVVERIRFLILRRMHQQVVADCVRARDVGTVANFNATCFDVIVSVKPEGSITTYGSSAGCRER